MSLECTFPPEMEDLCTEHQAPPLVITISVLILWLRGVKMPVNCMFTHLYEVGAVDPAFCGSFSKLVHLAPSLVAEALNVPVTDKA